MGRRKASRAIQIYADEEIIWSGPGNLLTIRGMIERRRAELACLNRAEYEKRRELEEDIEALEDEARILETGRQLELRV